MKQTAVEWLVQQMSDKEYILWNDKPWWDELVKLILIEQAKQMEKEQIIEAHTRAYLIGEDIISIKDAQIQSKQYYNETYGGNDHIGEANEMV